MIYIMLEDCDTHPCSTVLAIFPQMYKKVVYRGIAIMRFCSEEAMKIIVGGK